MATRHLENMDKLVSRDSGGITKAANTRIVAEMWCLELEGFDPLHFGDGTRAREAFHHYGRFTAARLSLVVASSDGAGRFFTAFDAPGDAAASAPIDAPNLPSRVARRAVFVRTLT
jgi:hypothetical protein